MERHASAGGLSPAPIIAARPACAAAVNRAVIRSHRATDARSSHANFACPRSIPLTVDEKRGSGYPGAVPLADGRSREAASRRRLRADALRRQSRDAPPGGQSALRHWHTLEDEFVYVLEGEVVLVTDAGEQTLHAGDCAGYPAGNGDGHHFINRSDAPARYLEVGNRDEADTAYYPDDDLAFADSGGRYMHKDGRPY